MYIIKDGAFGKHGSIQSRFTRDIAKKFLKGNNDYSFLNGYDVGSEIGIWAFGSGDIGGKFVGSITQLKSGDISVIGTIDYRFSDIFRDPYILGLGTRKLGSKWNSLQYYWEVSNIM